MKSIGIFDAAPSASPVTPPALDARRFRSKSYPVWLWTFPLVWTALIGVALWWNLAHIQKTVQNLAQVAAQSSFEKDIIYRQWASLHGGVYVPVTAQTPPNPYLSNIAERDITTPSGRPLTLVNPAYMTRQVHELAKAQYKHRGHITSLKPIRAENAPDAWERQALEAFARGATEISSMEVVSGEPHLRFMRPMKTTASCLKCHAVQGYKEGDIRGGISVAVPLRDYATSVRAHQQAELLAHGGVWFFGLVAFGVGAGQILRRRREHDRAEESLRLTQLSIAHASDALFWITPDAHIVEVNEAACRSLGYTRDELLKLAVPDVDAHYNAEKWPQHFAELRRHGSLKFESEQRTKAGQILPVEIVANYVQFGGRERNCAFVRDITERKRAEAALRQNELMLRESQTIAGLGSYVLNIPTGLWNSSEVLDNILGIDKAYDHSVAGWAALTHPNDRAMMVDYFTNEVVGQGHPFNKEYRILRHDNQAERWVHGIGKLEFNAQGQPVKMYGTIQDITERKRTEAEKARLETQLYQTQKIESVGRLAGGVAHDFNNMLQAILGNVGLALEEIPADSPAHDSLKEIQICAQRSADLTRQLLAFARRQAITPKVLDLNETVEGMLKMLRRLIGEDIGLAWLPTTDLWAVKVDPTQIDQILANLCVNARDAINGVGKVTIETKNEIFDEAYCTDHPGVAAGEFVRLAVSDNGCGMDKTTLAQIFEPFFTTKGVGEGTGLGLATVYGIVKQNNGFIQVYSEPGQGTTFKIYLPRHASQPSAIPVEKLSNLPASSGETLLLVEDEPAILAIALRILRRLGYTVLTASSPNEALHIAGEHTGKIHLLMTDVVMPEMNGRDLAKRLTTLQPQLKCLFMSGYTADVIARHGVLDGGVHFIQKPFSIEDLAAKIRLTLDQQA